MEIGISHPKLTFYIQNLHLTLGNENAFIEILVDTDGQARANLFKSKS